MHHADCTVSEVISRFLAHRTGKQLAATSVQLYRRKLAVWSAWRATQADAPLLGMVDLDELDRFFAYLTGEHVPHGSNPRRPAVVGQRLAPETVAGYRRVLRALWMFARSRGWLTPGQMEFFGRDGVQVARVVLEPRPVYEEDQFSAMLDACGSGEDEESARDRTIVAMLWESGGRISELLSIDEKGMQVRQRRAWIVGKGGRRRWLRWGPMTQCEVLRYLQLRRGTLGDAQPLFRATGPKAGPASRLRSDTARARLRRQMEKVGIALVEGSPLHAFRRSFIQRGIDNGVHLANVSQLAGHEDVRTTMRYALRNQEQLDQIYEDGYVRRIHRRSAEGARR